MNQYLKIFTEYDRRTINISQEILSESHTKPFLEIANRSKFNASRLFMFDRYFDSNVSKPWILFVLWNLRIFDFMHFQYFVSFYPIDQFKDKQALQYHQHLQQIVPKLTEKDELPYNIIRLYSNSRPTTYVFVFKHGSLIWDVSEFNLMQTRSRGLWLA